jgi:superfamily II DNA helicase RecQ
MKFAPSGGASITGLAPMVGEMPMTTDLHARATELLHELAGPDAAFREHQLEAIRDLVEDRARVLCVQRTGWG